VAFSSRRARELALEDREVGLESLRQVYDGTEFSAKHVAAAKAIASREREREAAAKTNGGDRI